MQPSNELKQGACPANPLLCFDGLGTNGKTSIFSMPTPFALSMSKGERGFAGQAPGIPLMATPVSPAQSTPAYWDVLAYLLVALSVAWYFGRKYKTNPDVEGATQQLRVRWGLMAGGLGLVLLRLGGYATGVDHVNWPFELVITAATVVAVIYATEPYANFLILRMPRHVEFRLAERWRRFVDQRSLLDPLIQAKLLLLLFEKDHENQMAFETSFQRYMNLLCAATYRAQKECFATFVWDITSLEDITLAAADYFDALKNSTLEISRIVIGSEDEIATVNRDHVLYRTTRGHNGRLYKVSTQELSTRGLTDVKDFAIFDGSLVVKGDEKPKEGEITGASMGVRDPSRKRVDIRGGRFTVKVLKGHEAAYQRSWKDQLQGLIRDRVVREV